MPRRHDGLFERIASFPALIEAARRAIRGKRRVPAAAAFMANLEREYLLLERQLLDGAYRHGRYRAFEVHDPKRRMVSAAPFRDRVVHHALCAVIAPIFERGFIDDSFANRRGKGTHRAIARYEHDRDRHAFVLRCDIFRYFPAIDHAILKNQLRRRIDCAPTLKLLDHIIDRSNPQERVDLHFPGDDLLAPIERRRGLPIGNLTSQLFANIYLDPLDHWIKERLRVPGYVRYVDDFALFGDDAGRMHEWRCEIERFLVGRRLILHPRKCGVHPTSEMACFLGLELYGDGRRRLPDPAVSRFRTRLRGLRDRWRAGSVDEHEVRRRVGGWIAHADQADSWRLRQSIFRGGWFDPERSLEACPTPSFAAAPGTTMPGTAVRRRATTTRATTATTISAFAPPARPTIGAVVSMDAAGASRGVQGGACCDDRVSGSPGPDGARSGLCGIGHRSSSPREED